MRRRVSKRKFALKYKYVRRNYRNYRSSGRLSGGRALSSPKGPSIDTVVRRNNPWPFSDDNLREIVEGRAHILTYRNVMACHHLDQVLGKFGAAIILYETKPSYGHWVALFKHSPGWVQFFDPYGYEPDSQLKYVPASMGCQPVLSRLFKEAGVQCMWSPYKLQSQNQSVSTCGRWAALRICLGNSFNPESFAALFMGQGQKLDPDSYVTLLTSFCSIFDKN